MNTDDQVQSDDSRPRYTGPQDVAALTQWFLLHDEEHPELWRDRNNVARLIDELTVDVSRYRDKQALEHHLIRLYDFHRAAERAAAHGDENAERDRLVFEIKRRVIRAVYRDRFGSTFSAAAATLAAEEIYPDWDQISEERRDILRDLRRGGKQD